MIPASCIPLRVSGDIRTIKITEEMLWWYPWIQDLQHKNIYLDLHLLWKDQHQLPDAPPSGYEYYITSGDSLMFGWPEHVIDRIDGKIIHLTGSLMPDSFDTDRIRYVPYNSAHRRIQGVARPEIVKNIQHKASAVQHRWAQSKAIIFAALKHILDETDCVVSLNQKIDPTQHQEDSWRRHACQEWQLTGNETCDRYTTMFKELWLDKKISLPDDDGIDHSYNNSAYQTAALNFTQESYHYSFMSNGTRTYVEPGPFVTEKTWKCLLSRTAFIPVGQAHTYKWFRQLGLKFNYGELDLGFDDDVGNLTRLEKIVGLIESLRYWSAQDLYEMTLESTRHNHDLVTSPRFWTVCEESNADVYKILKGLA
jgi:hypothetical protein